MQIGFIKKMSPMFNFALALLFLAAGLTACEQKKDRNNNYNNGYNQNGFNQNGYQTNVGVNNFSNSLCTNCPVGSVLFYQNVRVAYAPIGSNAIPFEWAMDVFGDSSSRFGLNDQRIMSYYSGPMSIQAAAQIRQNNLVKFCNAFSGDYIVRTMQAGTHSGGVINNLKFEMISNQDPSKRIVGTMTGQLLNFTNAFEYQTTNAGLYFYGTMYIETVNGRNCGQTIQSYDLRSNNQ